MPRELQGELRHAKRLAWGTIVFLVTGSLAMYLAMGSSQSMKTALAEDLLSFLPPAAFLVAQRVARREPDSKYPYGYHRVVTVAYLVAALALLAMGLLLLGDGLATLLRREHPTIGGVDVFGRRVWLGWLMVAALLYTSVPMVWLGYRKLRPARRLHDKVLYADAEMNKADWLTGAAALLGVLGISLGWWWSDATAAVIISLDVAWDGVRNTRAALEDIMDREPRTVDHRERLELDSKIAERLRREPEVVEVEVRLRENGHVFFGDLLVWTAGEEGPLRADRYAELAKGVDWRVHDVVAQVMVWSRQDAASFRSSRAAASGR
jgi:cation diffusion facilitator family transporter